MNTQLFQGDCLQVMRGMPDNSVDAIVTDPPYGLSFMGKKWDYDVPSVAIWSEALRVLKPGGHLLSFAGSRTYHRMTVNIEDAGFEIRDQIMWVYGSGFPKSLDISKAIDKAARAEREVVGRYKASIPNITPRPSDGARFSNGDGNITAPATEAAKQWQGWGTALKPAHEPICVARKPFTGTVAANVLEWGTGGLNVDGCRIEHSEQCKIMAAQTDKQSMTGNGKIGQAGRHKETLELKPEGRWPANFIHDGIETEWARYFYCAKASKRDRDEGCEGLEAIHRVNGNKWTDQDYRVLSGERPPSAESGPRRNHHPTVKPTDLMRYLVRLITPPNGVVLDPFMGSGSTGKAAMLEGFSFIGIEMSDEYLQIAKARIEKARGNQ